MTPEPVDIPVDTNDIRLQVAETLALDADGRRNEIAASMTARLGYPVTKTMIDQWTRGSRLDKNLSAAWIAAWCEATGSTGALEFICRQAGLRAVSPAVAEAGELALGIARSGRRVWELGAEVA